MKKQRENDEKLLKVLKWSFTSPLKEFVLQLKDQASLVLSANMINWMFSDDFKNHIKAIQSLQDVRKLIGIYNTKIIVMIVMKFLACFVLLFGATVSSPTLVVGSGSRPRRDHRCSGRGSSMVHSSLLRHKPSGSREGAGISATPVQQAE